FLELGLAEFSAGQPGWQDELAEAVESAGDDTTRIATALLFANALRWHERAAEAIEVCDRVAARLDGGDAEGRLTLEAMAVACGVGDAATAPLVADRASALLDWAAEGSVPRQCLSAAEADARALLEAPGPSAPPLLRNRATTVLVDVLIERGDLEEAERILEP